MKKLLCILALFIILISNNAKTEDFSLRDYYTGEYFAYSNEPISDKYVNLGSCVMNISEVSDHTKIVGESMTIENFEPISALKQLNAKLIKTENLQTGAQVFYAYSSKINSSVKLDGEKVNLQIAYYGDYSVIGWPLILGSF